MTLNGKPCKNFLQRYFSQLPVCWLQPVKHSFGETMDFTADLLLMLACDNRVKFTVFLYPVGQHLSIRGIVEQMALGGFFDVARHLIPCFALRIASGQTGNFSPKTAFFCFVHHSN